MCPINLKPRWILVAIYGFVTCLSGFSISILGPFYPVIAEEKGATPLQNGIVFSIYNLIMVIMCVLYGKFITDIGAIFMGSMGALTLATTTTLFGFLDKINRFPVFYGLSIIVRIFEAVGCAAFRISCICILVNEFQENQEFAFSIFQTFFGVGVTMGPILGGTLFGLGGFLLPFQVVGVLLFIGTLLTCFSSPKISDKDRTQHKERKGALYLLQFPRVIFSIAVNWGVAFNMGFIVINLSSYIVQLGIALDVAAYYFGCNGVSYFVSSFLWGKLNGYFCNPQFLWSIGGCLVFIGFLLMGISSFLHENSIYLFLFGLVCHGCGISAELIGSFSGLKEAAYSEGFEKDIATYGVIASLHSTNFCLAFFIGPIFGGLLYDSIGFIWSLLIYAIYHLSLVIGTYLYFKIYPKYKEYQSIC